MTQSLQELLGVLTPEEAEVAHFTYYMHGQVECGLLTVATIGEVDALYLFDQGAALLAWLKEHAREEPRRPAIEALLERIALALDAELSSDNLILEV